MRALSIRMPWVYFTLIGRKLVENRNKPTNHRGPLLLHCGLQPAFDWRPGVVHADNTYDGDFLDDGTPWPRRDALPRGHVVGVVEVVDCVQADEVMRRCFRDDPRQRQFVGEEGSCWVFRNPRRLKRAIPFKGKVGIFDVPDELLAGLLP